MTNSKKDIKYFISYAHNDEEEDGIVSHLLNNLQKNFCSSREYNYLGWSDKKILVGEKWAVEIRKALEECDFGLLLISLDFLNSDFISKTELPIFLEQQKCSIPVGLRHVSIEKHNLKGLEETQIFINNDKFYEDLENIDRRKFAFELFKGIEERLGKITKNNFTPEQIKYFKKELLKYEEIGKREINREESKHKEMTEWIQQFMDNKGESLVNRVLNIYKNQDIKIPTTPLETKYFKLDVQRFARKICYSLANRNEERIDTPIVNENLHFNSFDVILYRGFFSELSASMPNRMPKESKILFEQYIKLAIDSIQ